MATPWYSVPEWHANAACAGGNNITISGSGFPTSQFRPLSVDLGVPGLSCDISHASPSSVECTTRRLAAAPNSNGIRIAVVRLRAGGSMSACGERAWWTDQAARGMPTQHGDESACTVHFSPAVTPHLGEIAPSSAVGEQRIELALQPPTQMEMASQPVNQTANQLADWAANRTANQTAYTGWLVRLWRAPVVANAHTASIVMGAGPSVTATGDDLPEFLPASLAEFTALPQCRAVVGDAHGGPVQYVVPGDAVAGAYRVLAWHPMWGFAQGQPLLVVRAAIRAVSPSQGEDAAAGHERALQIQSA